MTRTAVEGTTSDGRPPFTATLSNHVPLVFGMDVSEVSAALGWKEDYGRNWMRQ
jgi:hypothetical protein